MPLPLPASPSRFCSPAALPRRFACQGWSGGTTLDHHLPQLVGVAEGVHDGVFEHGVHAVVDLPVAGVGGNVEALLLHVREGASPGPNFDCFSLEGSTRFEDRSGLEPSGRNATMELETLTGAICDSFQTGTLD